jgi:hypothetical protein
MVASNIPHSSKLFGALSNNLKKKHNSIFSLDLTEKPRIIMVFLIKLLFFR